MSRSKIQSVLDASLPPPSEDDDSPRLLRYFNQCLAATELLGIGALVDDGSTLDRSLYLKNVVKQRLDDITSFVARASQAGVLIAMDPAAKVRSLASTHRFDKDDMPDEGIDYYFDLADALTEVSTLVQREEDGEISLTREPRPQLSSMELSFQGIDGLPSDIFDASSLKRQQALEKLVLLDFTKRKVRVLFFAEYEHDGIVDLVVGWKKIRDATGYKVKFRDVINNRVTEEMVPSAKADAPEDDILQFYRSMLAPIVGVRHKERDVALLSLRKVSRNGLYSTKISAYQRVSSTKNELFRTTLNRLTLSTGQLDELSESIGLFTEQVEAVTPYPFLSELLYGDRKYGWVLAGLNVLSAYDRGEDISAVRSYSYLGAKLSDIRTSIQAGKFYVPSDIKEFDTRLSTSFSNFGLSNTLGEILEKCGILMFFDEREGFDVDAPSLDHEAALQETSAVAAILSAIDVETATVDPKMVYTNITTPPPGVGELRVRQIGGFEIQVPRLDTSDDVIDLLSFDGVRRLLDVVVDASRRAR